jgi:hypothetical protein
MQGYFRRSDHSESSGGAPAASTGKPNAEDDGRGALPSGHPLSWGALTAGTVLAGDAYQDWHLASDGYPPRALSAPDSGR